MERIHLHGIIFLTICVSVCMAMSSKDGSHLSGDNVCEKKVYETGWYYQNVSYKCWREVVRPDCSQRGYRWRYHDNTCYYRECGTCYAVQRVCTQRMVTKRFCCNGYTDNGNGKCVPAVDCDFGDGGCDQMCKSSVYYDHKCACLEGFTLDDDGRTCNDVDECLEDNGGCDQSCHNTAGSYYCGCENGYKLSGPQQCQEVDECKMGNGGCEHTCTNTDGAFYCECDPGYTLMEGFQCEDTDECALHNGGCSHTCNNYEGSYNCSCPSGSTLAKDGLKCLGPDIHPCDQENGGCSYICEERPNGYVCKCPVDQVLDTDGITCIDMGGFDGNNTNPNFQPVSSDMKGEGAGNGWIAGLVFGLLALLALIILAALLLKRYGRQWYERLRATRGNDNDAEYATCGAGVLPSKIAVIESEKASGSKAAAFDNLAYAEMDYKPPKYEDIYEDMLFPGKGGAAESKKESKSEVATKPAIASKPKPAPKPQNLYVDAKEAYNNPSYDELKPEKVEIKIVPTEKDVEEAEEITKPTTSKTGDEDEENVYVNA